MKDKGLRLSQDVVARKIVSIVSIVIKIKKENEVKV